MKRLLLFFTLLFSCLTFGQCTDYDKLKLGGTYLSRTNNYISFEIKHKDSIYREDISYPLDIKLIEKYSTFILSKAKTYIVNRSGEDFFKNIKMENIEVNYPKKVKVKYTKPKLYELKNYDIKYWILYTYKKGNYLYAFGLLFDKDGNMISENKFPDISKNPIFENYINPCEALSLVKNDERFQNKKVDFIKLAYLDEINSFCWLVKEEKKRPTKLGINEYHLTSFFVNANSSKLEKVTTENVSEIVCGVGKND